MPSILGINVGGEFSSDKVNSTTSSLKQDTERTVTQKQISQEGINKLIYDAMSADQGLASLATGENLSGGYGASTKALLAQDFMVKLIGELANVTAATISDKTGSTNTQTNTAASKKSGGLKTVICTELHRQGLLPSALYNHPAAQKHFNSIHPYTLAGYHLWAMRVVDLMKHSPLLCHLLLPIATARYKMITSGRTNLMGWLTIRVGHPVCFILGALANLGAGYGRLST